MRNPFKKQEEGGRKLIIFSSILAALATLFLYKRRQRTHQEMATSA